MPEPGESSENSLEELAAKCRKLASAIADQRATEALTSLAEEYERQVQSAGAQHLGPSRLSRI